MCGVTGRREVGNAGGLGKGKLSGKRPRTLAKPRKRRLCPRHSPPDARPRRHDRWKTPPLPRRAGGHVDVCWVGTARLRPASLNTTTMRMPHPLRPGHCLRVPKSQFFRSSRIYGLKSAAEQGRETSVQGVVSMSDGACLGGSEC